MTYTLVVFVTFFSIVKIGEITRGEQFYHTYGHGRFSKPAISITENLYQFTSGWLDLNDATSFDQALKVGFRVFVMGVKAQRQLSADKYWGETRYAFTTNNIFYFLLLAPILIFTSFGWFKESDRQKVFLFWVLIFALLLRHLFMMVFNSAQCILFSCPSIAIFWLISGLGINTFITGRNAAINRSMVGVLVLLCVMLFVHNIWYLATL